MNSQRSSVVVDYVVAFAIAAVAGLLYNHYKSGSHTSPLAVCGIAFLATSTAIVCAILVRRSRGRH